MSFSFIKSFGRRITSAHFYFKNVSCQNLGIIYHQSFCPAGQKDNVRFKQKILTVYCYTRAHLRPVV